VPAGGRAHRAYNLKADPSSIEACAVFAGPFIVSYPLRYLTFVAGGTDMVFRCCMFRICSCFLRISVVAFADIA
jgi:hypothetical protein